MKLHHPALAVIFAAITILSCQKENAFDPVIATPPPPVTPPPVVTCTAQKSFVHGPNNELDSFRYVYTNGLLTKLVLNEKDYVVLEYANNKVITRSYFKQNSVTAFAVDSVFYNAANLLTQLKKYEKLNSTSVLKNHLELAYTNAGKLEKLTELNGAHQKRMEYVYSYSGGDLTKADVTVFGNGSQNFAYQYKFDSKKNYFNNNLQALLVEGVLLDLFAELVPFYFSENNLVEIFDGANTARFNYILNDKNIVSEIKLNNQPYLKFMYECK